MSCSHYPRSHDSHTTVIPDHMTLSTDLITVSPDPHEEVVGFDVAMDKVLVVDVLYSANHLCQGGREGREGGRREGTREGWREESQLVYPQSLCCDSVPCGCHFKRGLPPFRIDYPPPTHIIVVPINSNSNWAAHTALGIPGKQRCGHSVNYSILNIVVSVGLTSHTYGAQNRAHNS